MPPPLPRRSAIVSRRAGARHPWLAAVLPAAGTGSAPFSGRGRAFALHPDHRSLGTTDLRPAAQAPRDAASATLRLPARTALAHVVP